MDIDKTIFWITFPYWAVNSLLKKHKVESKDKK